MTDCECIEACPFFNDRMSAMPATASMFKQRYCHTDSSECARHMVFKALGKKNVPLDLFPNQNEKAERIIAEGSRS